MTNEEAHKFFHISTEEIQKDIFDTEMDIKRWTEEAEHLSQAPMSLPTARWDHMRADARKSYIKEGLEFIEKLRSILEARNGQV